MPSKYRGRREHLTHRNYLIFLCLYSDVSERSFSGIIVPWDAIVFEESEEAFSIPYKAFLVLE